MSEPKELTGRHVLTILILAFGVIIGVNMVLMVSAIKTFPGLEVKNSYVASQDFNDAERAQSALGWTPVVRFANDLLVLTITDAGGNAVFPETLDFKIGRPTHGRDDMVLTLLREDHGYAVPVALGNGKWRIYLDAVTADGAVYSKHMEVFVTDGND